MNLWVFLYFVQLQGREALWSLLTVAAGAVIYQVFLRGRRVQA
jgi:hypothetical protein